MPAGRFGRHDTDSRGAKMILGVEKTFLRPAFLLGVLDVIKTTSNLVMVPVSVTDQQGQAVQGLQVADFRLEEEGKQQEISGIGDPEQVPLAIALLFDVSSSTSQKGFFASQQNAAATFLKLVMKPSDKAAIFTITDKPAVIQPLASAQT